MTSDCGRLHYCLKYSHPPPFHWVEIFPGAFDVGHGNGICLVPTVDGVNVLPVDLGLGHVAALANGRSSDVT